MTDQASGSSLPQTRDLRQQQQEQDQHRRHTHPHSRNVPSSHHNHNHNYNSNHNHNHNHNHQHLHHARSQRDSRPHQRDTSDDNADDGSDIVVVVETISVLQVTDLTGATIIKTLPHDYPATPVVTESRSESAVASSTKKPSSTGLPDTTSTSSASNDGNGVAHPSSSSSSTIEDPTVTPSESSMPTSFPTLSYASITATPLSAAPVFPSLGGLSNSTFSSSSSAFGNSSASLHSFTTTSEGGFSILGSATGTRSKTSSHPSASVFPQSPFGTSTSKSSSSVAHTYLTGTAKPEATTTSGGDGIGSPADTANGDGSAPTSGADSGSGSGNASAGTIAGSVVGAISGLAIILLLAATFLRWKKRKSSMKLIQESGNDRGYGAMITGGSGGPGGVGGVGGMSEHRRPIPFAIPAALANLTSQSRFSRSTVSSNGAEKGFTKVSGRKLPPVIQFGGDGYTDPRATMMSDQSIDYRASQNFFGEAALSRLAVGAPMLQETSTPVFHASPARTAIATPGPFSDPFSDDNRVESPTMPLDPVGRSHLPQDRSTRSHGSFSRFTEDI